ncbi:hypothetical protein ACFQBQ_05470 [Granulicella cerasi]|uniref:Uncharacterized protein n=1 Tax=Granulicella cerasi TaxID=741063 RepID=A0ABW1Z9F1_9BACT|nr:hypothetical protein [Granulicella cerasi]
MGISAIAVDSSGQIYLGGLSISTLTNMVLVYAKGATGTATPVRTFSTGVSSTVTAIAVDASGNIYVQDTTPAIRKFSSTGSLLGVITGGNTGLTAYPVGLAVDGNGYIYSSNIGTSYVSNTYGNVWRFYPNLYGNITGLHLQSSASEVFYGLAVDGNNSLHVSSDLMSGYFDELLTGAGTSGNSPTWTSASASQLGLTQSAGGTLAVNQYGDTFLLTQSTNGTLSISAIAAGSQSVSNTFTSTSLTTTSSNQLAGIVAAY